MNKFVRNRAGRAQGARRVLDVPLPDGPQQVQNNSDTTSDVGSPSVPSGWSPFYKSKRWLRLRSRAFAEYGNNCVMCGRTPELDGVILHVDHIKPRSLHPELALEITNLQILCDDCNLGKGNADDTDWRSLDHQAKATARAEARAQAKAERLAARRDRSHGEPKRPSKKEQRRLAREQYLRQYEEKAHEYRLENAKPENIAWHKAGEKHDASWLYVQFWFWLIAGASVFGYAILANGKH